MTPGTTVRLARLEGAAGTFLVFHLGQVGVVEEVRDADGASIRVRFGDGPEAASFWLKPGELEEVAA